MNAHFPKSFGSKRAMLSDTTVFVEASIETSFQFVRYALRRSRRSPGFTLTAVLTFGLWHRCDHGDFLDGGGATPRYCRRRCPPTLSICGNEASRAWDGATLRTIGAAGFLYKRRFGGG
jgi:hypothetical protein